MLGRGVADVGVLCENSLAFRTIELLIGNVVGLGSPSREPLAVFPDFWVKSPKCLFRHVVDAPTLWPLDAHCNKRKKKLIYQKHVTFQETLFIIFIFFPLKKWKLKKQAFRVIIGALIFWQIEKFTKITNVLGTFNNWGEFLEKWKY